MWVRSQSSLRALRQQSCVERKKWVYFYKHFPEILGISRAVSMGTVISILVGTALSPMTCIVSFPFFFFFLRFVVQPSIFFMFDYRK